MNSNWNSSPNKQVEPGDQQCTNNTSVDEHTANSAVGGYNDRHEKLSDAPKIKILGQQMYKTYRVDDRERQELHRQYGQDSLLLIFSIHSSNRLKECIGWGYQTRQNRVEQGGILLGHLKQYKSEIFSFVDDCVLADTRGSSAFVEFTPDMWSSMQQELDTLNTKRREDEQMAIIGWFHTHPNNLSVFMSGTDQDTQDKNFSQEWQVSVVLNPQKMKLRAFFGREIKEGKIVGWHNNIPKRPNEFTDEMTTLTPHITGNPSIDSKITGYEVKIREYEAKIDTYIKRITKLKKNVFDLLLIGVMLVLLLFSMGLLVNKLTNNASIPVVASEPPINQVSNTLRPELKEASVVMLSVVSEKWTRNSDPFYCDIVVEGTTADDVPYNSTHKIQCKSDNSFIELNAGRYTLTLKNLPRLTDDYLYKEVLPISIEVDGTSPKLVTFELETETKEVATTEPSSEITNAENEVAATTQPEISPVESESPVK